MQTHKFMTYDWSRDVERPFDANMRLSMTSSARRLASASLKLDDLMSEVPNGMHETKKWKYVEEIK